MASLTHAFPGSLRKPVEASRFSQGLVSRSRAVPPVAALKSRFKSLPEEPEDAQLTGATRSLNRRLLALNLNLLAVSRGA